ncbi:MAG: 4'-phosphopantetheinyl transferase superfamily protein, partial [Actinomycetia bacterium]|nr:4'-phosphopantetheinyl transferase superfamily protein [Actinomycetes bacterium]
ALLKKVDPDVFVNQLGGLLSGPDDRCRIVIFDPSEERLHLAAQIVRRGEPWFGLNDIWYTEKPLVADGGKIAFVFPGWEFMDGIEHDSLLDEFGLSWHEPTDDETYPGSGLILDHYFTSMLAHDALVKSGIRPDVYAGHSIGEWHAARAAGMVDEEFDKAMVALPLDPANQLDPDIIPDFRLVAASGGLDEEAIAAIEAEVPDAYLTTDNCPSQKVFCVLAGSLDRLTATLKARHVGCTVLPYASPLHTPFVAPVLDAPLQALSTVPTHAGEAPVWSSVLVAKLDPANATAAELLGPQLTRPIRFRALLEEMYAQGVRVFVQCGAGSLTGFVDDTLHGRDFAALPAVTSLRPAVDQLRRLHALMFILGGPADLEFMGMGPLVRNLKSLYLMPSGFPVLTEVPAFTELLAPRLKDPATVAAEPPAPTPAPPGKTPSAPPDAPAPPPRPPMAWQTDALGLPVRGFSRSRPVPSGPWPWPAMGGMPGAAWPGTLPAGAVPAPQPVPPPPAPAPPPPAPVTDPPVPPRDAPPEPATVPPVHANPFQDPVTEAIWRAHPEETVAAPAVSPSARRRKRRGGSRAGTSFTEPLDLDLDRFPEVMDHCIVNQPVDWPYREDVCPVVPLTLSMELMAELAMRHAPGQKVVKLGPITAMNFMPVNEPFHATVKGFWKSNDVLSLSVAGHLMMDVTFANEYPDPPVEYVTRLKAGIGAKRREPVDREEQYLEYTFHRPRYWSLDHTILMGEHGFHSEVRKAEGKGSLLDAIGQAVGLYLHLYEDHDTVSFPVRVNEVSFYQDMFDQDGAFDSYCHIREVTDNFVIGDAVYERDGKIWVVARGWANQRIPMDQVMWESVIHPWRAMLSREIAPHVYAFDYENPSRSSITFLALRYLTADEKRQGGSMPSLSAQGDYLAGRIALKDAARAYLRGSGPGYVYPIEVASAYEESGKLLVRPHDGDAFPVPLHVSLAHRDNRGVAVASGAPVGIDLERIEHRDQGFWDLAFTSTEQELIRAQATPDEAATRVWVAKEAVGKQRGTGLHGAPTRIVATRIEDGAILLDGVWVDTMKLDDGYIVGRTREELLT